MHAHTVLYSAGFVAALPGDYRYQCPEVGVQGNMSIVQAQYSIAVCSGCSNHSNEYRLNTGEVLQWAFVRMEGEKLREAVNCTSQVWRDDRLLTSMDQCELYNYRCKHVFTTRSDFP